MIDHLSLRVRNYELAKKFYTAALEPLGYELLGELTAEQTPNPAVKRACCFGEQDTPELWIDEVEQPMPTHVAFVAKTHAAVDAFHAAALAAGGTDHGAPGLRSAPYPPGYYAAFVVDPDGYNIEAVCRTEPPR